MFINSKGLLMLFITASVGAASAQEECADNENFVSTMWGWSCSNTDYCFDEETKIHCPKLCGKCPSSCDVDDRLCPIMPMGLLPGGYCMGISEGDTGNGSQFGNCETCKYYSHHEQCCDTKTDVPYICHCLVPDPSVESQALVECEPQCKVCTLESPMAESTAFWGDDPVLVAEETADETAPTIQPPQAYSVHEECSYCKNMRMKEGNADTLEECKEYCDDLGSDCKYIIYNEADFSCRYRKDSCSVKPGVCDRTIYKKVP